MNFLAISAYTVRLWWPLILDNLICGEKGIFKEFYRSSKKALDDFTANLNLISLKRFQSSSKNSTFCFGSKKLLKQNYVCMFFKLRILVSHSVISGPVYEIFRAIRHNVFKTSIQLEYTLRT